MAHRTVFTIGHSNRDLEEFLELLQIHGIERVVDVRKMPRSRSNPQFNGPDLAAVLQTNGLDYFHLEALTGFRRRGAKKIPNAWENKSFQAYASYMQTDEFAAGIVKLLELSSEKTVTVMCSEAVWWRCHRRMIADALLARGIEVRHILSKNPSSVHELTSFAVVDKDRVSYPEASADATRPLGELHP